ncbi:MAG: hypothetical protein HZA35_01395 [Parcubacteria group bacterium]|nr:hypothetical protein [Parcubacteria group bacterium]
MKQPSQNDSIEPEDQKKCTLCIDIEQHKNTNKLEGELLSKYVEQLENWGDCYHENGLVNLKRCPWCGNWYKEFRVRDGEMFWILRSIEKIDEQETIKVIRELLESYNSGYDLTNNEVNNLKKTLEILEKNR